eukprot:4667376-Pyramimonas_sp.AAC.1
MVMLLLAESSCNTPNSTPRWTPWCAAGHIDVSHTGMGAGVRLPRHDISVSSALRLCHTPFLCATKSCVPRGRPNCARAGRRGSASHT